MAFAGRHRAGQPVTPVQKKPIGPRDVQDTPDLEKYFLASNSAQSSSSSSSSGPSKCLYCPICADVFKRPMRAPCGHSFCQRCITTWLSMNKTCPQDRKPLTPNQLHHDFIIESLIAEMPAVCPYKRQGCRFGVRTLNEVRQHAPACDFNPDNMPDFIRAVLPVEEDEPAIAEEDVYSPVVVVLSSDDDSDVDNNSWRPQRRAGQPSTTTPVTATNRTAAAAAVRQTSPIARTNTGSNDNAPVLPLRLRLLRQGIAVDQLRDVVGASSNSNS